MFRSTTLTFNYCKAISCWVRSYCSI